MLVAVAIAAVGFGWPMHRRLSALFALVLAIACGGRPKSAYELCDGTLNTPNAGDTLHWRTGNDDWIPLTNRTGIRFSLGEAGLVMDPGIGNAPETDLLREPRAAPVNLDAAGLTGYPYVNGTFVLGYVTPTHIQVWDGAGVRDLMINSGADYAFSHLSSGNGWFAFGVCSTTGPSPCATKLGWGYVDLATGVEQDFLLPQWGGLDPASDGASVVVQTGSDTGDPSYTQTDISLWQPGFASYLPVSSGHHGDRMPQVAGNFVVFIRGDADELHLVNWRTGRDIVIDKATVWWLGKNLLLWPTYEGTTLAAVKEMNLTTGQVFTFEKRGDGFTADVEGDLAALAWGTLEPPPSCWYHSELVTADSSGNVTSYGVSDYIEDLAVYGGRVAYTTRNRK